MPSPFHHHPVLSLEAHVWRDPWLMASTLQKAIRRGEVDIAHRAVLALHDLRGANVWRRLLVIAFEDIGIGKSETVADITALASDALQRKRPMDPAILMRAVRALADAPKDRSADYLMSIVALAPALEPLRARLGSMTIADRLAVVADSSVSVEERAMAAWYASGLDVGDERRLDKGGRPALMRTFLDLGVPEPLVRASAAAANVTREAICVLVPLIWLVSQNGSRSFEHPAVRPSPRLGGLPLYALGMHTRSGRAAIAAFAKTPPIREVMERWVPDYRTRDVAFVAEFHVDGGAITPRLQWPEGQRLKRMAIKADLVHAGAAREGVGSILTVFRENLKLLDAIRERLLKQTFGGEIR